jgi:predicted alpha/beta superfamily hydrolase
MVRHSVALALLALTSVADVMVGQRPSSSNRAEYTIQSTNLGTTRKIFVVTPQEYSEAESRFAVLLLLDAEDNPQFDAAVANVAFLASRRQIGAMIVVGIPNGRNRTRDLTPRPSARTARENRGAGGAAPMASFIVDEVLPLVRSNYRTLPTAVLAGHSFGGLFALHLAASKPDAFDGIISMSPALWWNEWSAINAYADSIAKITAPLRLFATSGGLERDIDVTTRRFAARLDSIKPATLRFEYKRYPDDTHAMTPAQSLVDGLRFIFDPVARRGDTRN